MTLLVLAGAAVGAPLRLLAGQLAVRRGRDAAAGTLAVNVAGSALLGVVLGVGNAPSWVLAAVGTGFCGTLTTFSAFGADVVRLVEARTLARAVGYVLLTLVLGLGAAAVGYVVAGAAVRT
ncbi:CrcB family protein [Geodermatophilus sp. YIM 151500]|uniref:fluoride efflux transporter FluC n=1 Tax=Geodermatophilus sp. YIM 151500 TaxID=2984531 RepID=UPI0021E44B14|nr:CrcB family protein [Geodermatophilus sp. YIM 151500]MCV2491993.1 CrcB family protein [Geodermatophilus sp. YIM 151500]